MTGLVTRRQARFIRPSSPAALRHISGQRTCYRLVSVISTPSFQQAPVFGTRRARKYHARRFVTSCLLLQKKLCSSFIRQDQRLSCKNFKTTLPKHSAHCLPTHTTKASFKAFTNPHALAERSPNLLLPLVSNCQQPFVCTKIWSLSLSSARFGAPPSTL